MSEINKLNYMLKIENNCKNELKLTDDREFINNLIQKIETREKIINYLTQIISTIFKEKEILIENSKVQNNLYSFNSFTFEKILEKIEILELDNIDLDELKSEILNMKSEFFKLKDSLSNQKYVNLKPRLKYYDKLNSIGENDFLVKNKYRNLQHDIIKYLNAKDLTNLGMTCKTLQAVTNSNEYWDRIYTKEYNYFMFLQGRDQCEIMAKNEYFSNFNDKYLNSLNLRSKYFELKKLDKNLISGRPIVTTISASECVTCLHLDPIRNELIYGAADGSATMIRLYSIRKNLWNGDIYMQHHKQNKICDTISSFHGHGGSIWSLDRHKEVLFTGSYDKTIKLWNTKSGNCQTTIRAHDSWVSSINYDPENDMLVSGSWDTTMKIWNLKQFQNVSTFSNELGNYVYCVRANLNFNEVISGNEFKTVDIWDVSKNLKKATFTGHLERVNCLRFHQDSIFSGSDDKTAKLWDKRTRIAEMSISGHTKGLTQIEYDPNRSMLITSSIDKTIKFWDIRKQQEVRTLVGHSSSISSLAIDHTKIISGSNDKSIRIWNFLN